MSKRKYKLSAFLIALFAATCNAESEFHVIKGIPGGELYARQEDVSRDGAVVIGRNGLDPYFRPRCRIASIHVVARNGDDATTHPRRLSEGGQDWFRPMPPPSLAQSMARTSSGRRKTIGSRRCSSWQVRPESSLGVMSRHHQAWADVIVGEVKLLLRCGRIMTCRRGCPMDEWRQRNSALGVPAGNFDLSLSRQISYPDDGNSRRGKLGRSQFCSTTNRRSSGRPEDGMQADSDPGTQSNTLTLQSLSADGNFVLI